MLYNNSYNSQLSSDNVVDCGCICHNKIANIVAVYDTCTVYCIQYSVMFIISYSVTQQQQHQWLDTFTGDQQLQE